MEELVGVFGGLTVIVVVILLVYLAILAFLLPYFVYKISCNTTDIRWCAHRILSALEKLTDKLPKVNPDT